MQVGTLDEIHRYPVKSMLGERLGAVPIGEDGIRGDRAWATRDEGRGGIEGARKLPFLLRCAARFPETVDDTGPLPVPEIELPDGTRLSADDPEAALRLSKLGDRPLTLWPRRPADDEEHYSRGAPDHDDMLTELRMIFARNEDEPLPDIGKFPPEILTASTVPGTCFDCYPLLVLTRTSLATLQASQPESRFDVRRFRPNLLIESFETGGFPENDWVGGRIRIGEVVLAIPMECPRCVMTTHGFADLPQDPKIMRTLVAENGGNVGVYAAIETPGVVREGDSIELID